MSKKKEIWGLLLLLGSSVVSALLVVGYMAYYWGPSGGYSLNNVLLAPSSLTTLSYQEVDPVTGGGPRMVFHQLTYIHGVQDGREWRQDSITEKAYAAFYELVSAEKSVREVDSAIHELFMRGSLSSLQLRVRAEMGRASVASRIFQEVNFSPDGDYYRVELRLDKEEHPWAYFYHPGIGTKVDHLFGGER